MRSKLDGDQIPLGSLLISSPWPRRWLGGNGVIACPLAWLPLLNLGLFPSWPSSPTPRLPSKAPLTTNISSWPTSIRFFSIPGTSFWMPFTALKIHWPDALCKMDPKTYHNCEHRLHMTITSLRFQLQCSHRSWWGHHPRGSSMAESVTGLGVLVCKHWHAWIPFEIDGSSQVSWDSRRSTGPLDRRSHPLQGWRCFPAIGHMKVADSAEDPTFSKLLSVFDQLQSKGRKKEEGHIDSKVEVTKISSNLACLLMQPLTTHFCFNTLQGASA